jgi:hypothetical protein
LNSLFKHLFNSGNVWTNVCGWESISLSLPSASSLDGGVAVLVALLPFVWMGRKLCSLHPVVGEVHRQTLQKTSLRNKTNSLNRKFTKKPEVHGEKNKRNAEASRNLTS